MVHLDCSFITHISANTNVTSGDMAKLLYKINMTSTLTFRITDSQMIKLYEFTCTYTTSVFLHSDGAGYPHFVEEPSSAVVTKSSSKVVLRCRADPVGTEVRWLYNGSELSTNHRPGFRIEDGELHILSFRQGAKDMLHVGLYQCIANNSYGAIISKEARLEVAGKYIYIYVPEYMLMDPGFIIEKKLSFYLLIFFFFFKLI